MDKPNTAAFEEAKRIRAHLAGSEDDPCTYCSYPEGWDACPLHRDGVPTPPPATPSQ